MTSITILQAAVFLAYVLYIRFRFGTLFSISSSTYRLRGNERLLFFLWLALLAILNWFQGMGIYGDVMSLGFVMAGMSFDHRRSTDTPEDELHTIGTIAAVAAGFLGLYALHGMLIPTIGMVIGATLLYLFSKNWIWYTEIWAFVMITFGYLVR